MKWKDPIVEEVRTIRKEIERECHDDMKEIYRRAVKLQQQLSDKLVTRGPAYCAKKTGTHS